MNFLTISEILDFIAGSSSDPCLNQRLDELDSKIDSLRELVRLHDQSGTPSTASIIDVLRYELQEVV